MSTTQELTAGALVTPSIRLVRELGRGGMGSVWIAEHLRLRTQVVVKFMAAEYALNYEAMQRFEREATLAAQAKSPHVVQVFDHGVSEFGLPYIAMELLEGQDLAHYIASAGTVEPTLFANWLSQACRGLSRAHGKGIVHRDIKPENIFLCDNDGEVLVKVLDFGIAKADGVASGFAGTQTGAFLGTAYYMSPEQTMGVRDLDGRSDLWSLGVVAFYALTGTRPFDGDAIGALVMAITMGALPVPSSRNPRLGPSIDAWMAKALARAREERFQSAKEMAAAFQLAVGATQSSDVGFSDRGSLPDQPAPLVTSGGAVARTNPTALRASTMSPSVRPGEPDPVVLPKSRFPFALAAGVAVIALAAAALWALRASSNPASPEAAAAAAPSSTESAPAPAPAPTPVIAAAPTSPPTAPSVSAAPVAELAPAQPPARDASAALKKPGAATRAASPAAASPAAATPAAATPAAAPAPPAPVAAPAKQSPAAPAAKPNPLQMKME